MTSLIHQINEALGDPPTPLPGDRHFGLSMQQRHALTDDGWIDEVISLSNDVKALEDCCHHASTDLERASNTGVILKRILGTAEGLIRDGGFDVT